MKLRFVKLTTTGTFMLAIVLGCGCIGVEYTEEITLPENGASESSEQEEAVPQESAAVDAPAQPISAENFPMPEGAEEPLYNSDTSTIMFHQKGTVEKQADFYSEKLAILGWKKQPSSEIADGVAFLDFEHGDLSITVTINPGADGKIATIAQGNGLKVPETGDDNGE